MSPAKNRKRRVKIQPFQLNKTKICSFFQASRCSRGEDCKFAHSAEELESAPDLAKTCICLAWEKGQCPDSAAECRFAHGAHDLRHDPRPIPAGLVLAGSPIFSGRSLSQERADLEPMNSDSSRSSDHAYAWTPLNATASPWHPSVSLSMGEAQRATARTRDQYMASMDSNALSKNEPPSFTGRAGGSGPPESLVPTSKLFGASVVADANLATQDWVANGDGFSVFSGKLLLSC